MLDILTGLCVDWFVKNTIKKNKQQDGIYFCPCPRCNKKKTAILQFYTLKSIFQLCGVLLSLWTQLMSSVVLEELRQVGENDSSSITWVIVSLWELHNGNFRCKRQKYLIFFFFLSVLYSFHCRKKKCSVSYLRFYDRFLICSWAYFQCLPNFSKSYFALTVSVCSHSWKKEPRWTFVPLLWEMIKMMTHSPESQSVKQQLPRAHLLAQDSALLGDIEIQASLLYWWRLSGLYATSEADCRHYQPFLYSVSFNPIVWSLG